MRDLLFWYPVCLYRKLSRKQSTVEHNTHYLPKPSAVYDDHGRRDKRVEPRNDCAPLRSPERHCSVTSEDVGSYESIEYTRIARGQCFTWAIMGLGLGA